MTEFIETRDKMKAFLTSRQKLKELEVRAGVSRSTVSRTFQVNTEDQLIGSYIDVWNAAVELIEEIKLLPDKAKKLMENE